MTNTSKPEVIWECKIGGPVPGEMPDGWDFPMRRAVQAAFLSLTGVDAEFTFSGRGNLTEGERAVVEKRAPAIETIEDLPETPYRLEGQHEGKSFVLDLRGYTAADMREHFNAGFKLAAKSLAAPAPVAPTPAQPSQRSQHDADSKELRSLCRARDEARRERDLLRVDVAALESSVGHLSRLVDDLRPGHDRYQYLRERPVDTIDTGGVFAGLVPDNVVLNGEDLDRAIDAALPSEPEGQP
jgi:hypothetical protein